MVQKKGVTLAQTGNPVVNPPFNNWSVNQPSPPHQIGNAGKADLGQEIIVDGHHVHYLQTDSQINMQDPPENLGMNLHMDGMVISVAQKK